MNPGDLIRIKMLSLGGTFKPALGTVLEVLPNPAGKFERIRMLFTSGEVKEIITSPDGYEVIREGG